jgi:hypothetical protein
MTTNFFTSIGILFLMLLHVLPVSGQILYFNTQNGTIYTLDVATCQTNLITTAVGSVYSDMANGPGNTIYGLNNNVLYNINSANGTSTTIATVNASGFVNSVDIGPNGLVYLVGQNVYTVNPTNGAITDCRCISYLHCLIQG